MAPPQTGQTGTTPSNPAMKILEHLQGRKSGFFISDMPWQEFDIQPQEYGQLLSLLKDDQDLLGFVEDKVRYDYDPTREKFVLRLHTLLHGTFIARVTTEIQSRLATVGTNDPRVRAFTQKIKCINGRRDLPTVGLDGRQSIIRREPDAMFGHNVWSGVVIEVSDSQKRKALPDLANDYIRATNGSIRVVVGLNLEYNGSQKATISLWRLQRTIDDKGEEEYYVAKILKEQLFRNDDGQPNLTSGSGLRLELSDFATDDLGRDVPGFVLVDSSTLCQLLRESEEIYQRDQELQGSIQPAIPPFKRRWREKTQPEELRSEDEV